MRFLLDSGTGLNLIARGLADRLAPGTEEMLSKRDAAPLSDACGRPMGSVVRATAEQPIAIAEVDIRLSFGTSEGMASNIYDAILGAPFFRAHAVSFDYKAQVAYARGRLLGRLLPPEVRALSSV